MNLLEFELHFWFFMCGRTKGNKNTRKHIFSSLTVFFFENESKSKGHEKWIFLELLWVTRFVVGVKLCRFFFIDKLLQMMSWKLTVENDIVVGELRSTCAGYQASSKSFASKFSLNRNLFKLRYFRLKPMRSLKPCSCCRFSFSISCSNSYCQ